jgi:hypothetical protein
VNVSQNWEIFVNASASWFDYTENWGMNRPTQDLIDNGLYITGINNNNADEEGNYTPSDPQNSVHVLGGGNSLDLGPAVKISRHARLLKPGDNSTGREFNAQAIQTIVVSDSLKIVNNTFWSYTARNTLSSYYYSEIIDPSWFAENRTEFHITKPYVSMNAGLDVRYQKTQAYDDYFFEPANVWDLTKDVNFIDVYNATDFYGRFVGQPVPGWPDRYATQGVINGDTNHSSGTTVGPFVQATWKVNERLNVITGARYDRLHARARSWRPRPRLPGSPRSRLRRPRSPTGCDAWAWCSACSR